MTRLVELIRAHRDEGVGLMLCAAVAVGLSHSVLTHHPLAQWVTWSPAASTHPVLSLISAVSGLVVATVIPLAVWWGPVRVRPAQLRWQLGGPDGRRTTFLRARRRATVVLTIGSIVVAESFAIVLSSNVCVAAGTGAAVGLFGFALATVAQHRRSARSIGRRWVTTEQLSRTAVAPRDGLEPSLLLAATTLDLDWLSDTRTLRWLQKPSRRRSRRWPTGRWAALVAADAVRLRRRTDEICNWLLLVAISLAVPLVISAPIAAPTVACLLAYRAGRIASGGLRRTATNRAIGRTLGISDHAVVAAFAVLPAASIGAWALIVGWTWPLSLPQLGIICAGAVVGTLRRATRGPVPLDAPFYLTGTGGVVQPLLWASLVRGLGAVACTAMIATALQPIADASSQRASYDRYRTHSARHDGIGRNAYPQPT
ncbi:DUF6297 family protein [Williamsia sp. CHRR-6]|uniref:DUF6297 family protein n=1 Tax=Williamsia sp. CHRR-6 TaxID=2835871 RepID=UPI001BDA4B42|nr:DUF6297 family protein [Williamsia sp. CHRR-6]MBT0565815.1 hypothetical protein [Williamsia sp. CHRR-6]